MESKHYKSLMDSDTMITKDTKISKLLSEFPQTLEVLINFSPHFRKLNNKILRRTFASRVNVEQAAGIAGINLVLLLNELNKSIGDKSNPPGINDNLKETIMRKEKPELLKKINPEKILQLDVRPIIDSGRDPFLEIMSAIKSLKEDEVFHLINSFEPIPLYTVLEKKGYDHWMEKTDETFNVFFFRNKEKNAEKEKTISEDKITDKDFENVIELDVRGLAPPEPMMMILENIWRVDEKTVMVVHHHREPMMLYPKLEERGYSAVTNRINDNYFKVVITKRRKS